jgi:glycosyltransferase involved in cell wall biosynthesis
MRIAQVAPLVESVPPRLYGGTERVIAGLVSELTALGHEVTLYASGDSQTRARLIPMVEASLWRSDTNTDAATFHVVELARVTREAADYDIVHSHLDVLGLPFGRRSPTPFIHTLHGRLDVPELQTVFGELADVPVVSISDSQRSTLPNANWVRTVHNGISLEQVPFGGGRGSYLAFLGRISPEKGLLEAIEVANRTGLPLKIAARMPLTAIDNAWVRADWDYYNEQIKPLLCNPGIEFLGELDDHDKYEMLSEAAALVFPINWPEPFGLAMIEALACGTPVIARAMASTPEIVRHGQTGFLCNDVDQMTAACSRISEIDRRVCRQEAEQRFSARSMALGYLDAYRMVREGRSLLDQASAVLNGRIKVQPTPGGAPALPPRAIGPMASRHSASHDVDPRAIPTQR